MGFKLLILGLLLGIFTGCGKSEISAHLSLAASPSELSDKQTPQEAYQRLLATKVFAFGGIGYAGVTSEGEKAFQAIVASTNAVDFFEAAITNGNTAAQLYALCGLRKLAPERFDLLARTLMSANPNLTTMSGCLQTQDRASNVVAQIIRGQYDSYINRPK